MKQSINPLPITGQELANRLDNNFDELYTIIPSGGTVYEEEDFAGNLKFDKNYEFNQFILTEPINISPINLTVTGTQNVLRLISDGNPLNVPTFVGVKEINDEPWLFEDTLNFETTYIFYYDGKKVIGRTLYSELVSVPDENPPIFTVAPAATGITSSSFSISATTNELAKLYAVSLPNLAAAPTSAEVKAGTGSGGIPPIEAVSDLVSKTDFLLNFTADPETNYDVYVVAEDDFGNLQENPVKVDVLTLAEVIFPSAGLIYQNLLEGTAPDRFGTPNKATSFTSTNIVVADNNDLDFTGDFTIALRFNTSTKSAAMGLIDKWTASQGWVLYFPSTSGLLRFAIQPLTNNATTATDKADGAWHFVIIRKSGTLVKMEVDDDAAVLFSSSSPVDTAEDMNIGGDGASTIKYTGIMDDIFLWNRGLTDQESLNVKNYVS